MSKHTLSKLALLSLLSTNVGLAGGCGPAREAAEDAADPGVSGDRAPAAAPAPADAPAPAAAAAPAATEIRTTEAGVPLVAQVELIARIEAGSAPLILDVRTAEEFAESHVPGAINISHDELEARLGEIEGARENGLVVYCRSGRRAGIAEELLRQQGFTRLQHLEGDMLAWLEAGLPTENQR